MAKGSVFPFLKSDNLGGRNCLAAGGVISYIEKSVERQDQYAEERVRGQDTKRERMP